MPIAAIAAATRISPTHFEALERSDLSRWPRGLYARNFIRAYAAMVGLDPADTVDEFCRLFPHGDRRARDTFREFGGIISHASAYRDEVREPDRRRRGTQNESPAAQPRWSPLRPLQWVLGGESR